MALLLRLDSVQGAHSDVREVRKIITKEVIAFQEIIDSTSKDASTGKKIISFPFLQHGHSLYLVESLCLPKICLTIGRGLIF